MITGYVPGVYDMLHLGHLRIIEATAARCDRLIVGVVTDDAPMAMKGRQPVIPFDERIALVAALRMVDAAVADVGPDKRIAWRAHRFDIVFKGDDWQGTPKGDRLEAQMREIGATVRYLPYTKGVSSSVLRPRRYHRVGDSVTADVTPDPVAASGNRPSTIR